MILQSWYLVTPCGEGVSVVAPEFADGPSIVCLCGEVLGHPKFEDGRNITTSAIVGIDERGGVLTKNGSRYDLQTVFPRYEDNHPGARTRLLDVLSKRFPN